MTQPTPTHTCDELGVCQGLSAEQCPHCDSFECEVACAPAPLRRHSEAYPTPTYPFAPGVLEHEDYAAQGFYTDHEPMNLKELLVLLALVLVCCSVLAGLAGYVAGRFA